MDAILLGMPSAIAFSTSLLISSSSLVLAYKSLLPALRLSFNYSVKIYYILLSSCVLGGGEGNIRSTILSLIVRFLGREGGSSAFLILYVFAIFNAGIVLDGKA